MFSLEHFFKKFKDMRPPERAQKEAVARALIETLDITLKKEDIHISGTTARLNTDSVTRAEIFLQKEVVLEHIRTSAPGVRITTLR